MPRYVVPDTVEHALELLDAGLLYRNGSIAIPRNQGLWKPCEDPDTLRGHLLRAYQDKQYEPIGVRWCINDFAYVLED